MKLDKKQRIILVITVLAFVFLGWQVYDLVAGDVVPGAKAKTPATATRKRRRKKSTLKKSTAKKKTVVNTKPIKAKKLNTNTNAALAAEQSEYTAMANQFELAKMQSALLAKQLQIATARKRIAEISGSSLEPVATQLTDKGGIVGLRLAYVAKVNGVWAATVINDGQYQTVKVGSTLPNGSLVSAIDSRGVIFRQGGRTKALTFNGMIVVSHPYQVSGIAPKAAEPVSPLSAAKKLAQLVSKSANLSKAEVETVQNEAAVTAAPKAVTQAPSQQEVKAGLKKMAGPKTRRSMLVKKSLAELKAAKVAKKKASVKDAVKKDESSFW